MGVYIDVPSGGSLDQRFATIIDQIQTLPPQQQTMFNLLQDQYTQELRQKELDERQREENQNLAEQFRQSELKKMQERKKKKSSKEWASRLKTVAKSMTERQEKRKQNLADRKTKNKTKAAKHKAARARSKRIVVAGLNGFGAFWCNAVTFVSASI